MDQMISDMSLKAVALSNPQPAADIVLVCEHASNLIPAEFAGLGLPDDLQAAHIAWDPGAQAVATELSQILVAPLVAAGLSRLLYDCNRPPEAVDAIPTRSEVYDIPGNIGLDAVTRRLRIDGIYLPFRTFLADTIMAANSPALITIHSFTPLYKGVRRFVDIGILHDSDSRLADVMLNNAARFSALDVLRNDPYGPDEGVTHTLKTHAIANGLVNVMIEIRNDLIDTATKQRDMAAMLGNWLRASLSELKTKAG